MHVKSFPSKDQGPSQKWDRLSIEPGVRADQGKTNFSGSCIHKKTSSMDFFSQDL